jgi:hypothetical protein
MGSVALEQLVRDLVAEHDDGAPLVLVEIGERPAALDAVVLHLLIGRGDAANGDVADLASAPLDVRERRGNPEESATGRGVVQLGAHHLELGASDHGRRRAACTPRRLNRPIWIGMRRTWKAFVPISELATFSFTYEFIPWITATTATRKGDRHDDAEQREEAPQLVGADLGERRCG